MQRLSLMWRLRIPPELLTIFPQRWQGIRELGVCLRWKCSLTFLARLCDQMQPRLRVSDSKHRRGLPREWEVVSQR